MTPTATALNISITSLPFDLTASELLERLAQVKAAEKTLKAHSEELLAMISEAQERGDLEALSYEPGIYEVPGLKLTQASRTVYQYSPAIKALQKAEQENGMATAKTTTYWTAKLT